MKQKPNNTHTTMKRKQKITTAILGFSLLTMVSAQAASLVINGDFETTPPGGYGAIPSWNQVPNPSGYASFDYLSGAEGWLQPLGVTAWDNGYVPGTGQFTNKVAFIETYGSASTLSLTQLVTGFTIGQVYELSYYENGRANPAVNTTTAETFVGGVSVVAAHLVTPVNLQGQYTNPFYYRTAQFTATANQMLLEFRATQVDVNDTFLVIDNVAINAVPEPGSALLGGLGLLALLRRRRSA